MRGDAVIIFIWLVNIVVRVIGGQGRDWQCVVGDGAGGKGGAGGAVRGSQASGSALMGDESLERVFLSCRAVLN